MTEAYKLLEEADNILKIEKDLIEIQKTIIHFGKEILQKLTDINKILQKEYKVNMHETDQPIATHLSQIKIPEGYKGNNLKW